MPDPVRRRIVVADAGLAHDRDRVEHRVAGQIGIRIGAGVEQLGREREVRVAHGQEQRASCRRAAAGRHSRAGAAPSTGIGSFTSTPASSRTRTTVEPSFAHRKQQRREAGRQPPVDVRAGRDRASARRRHGLRRRPTSARSVRAPRPCRPPRAVREQRLDRARARRSAPRSSAASRRPAARRFGIGAGLQQPLDERAVAVGAGDRERRHAVAVRRLHIRAGAQRAGPPSRRRRAAPPSAAPSCRRPAARSTSARWVSSARTRARSAFSAASASGESGPAARHRRPRSGAPATTTSSTTKTHEGHEALWARALRDLEAFVLFVVFVVKIDSSLLTAPAVRRSCPCCRRTRPCARRRARAA